MPKYVKNFDEWNKTKKKIDEHDVSKLYFNEREIWWTSVGVNVGSETDGKNQLFERPVLVYRKLGSGVFIGIPITSKQKKGPFFTEVKYDRKSGTASVLDMRSFSYKRLIRKMTTLSKEEFKLVAETVRKMLD